MSSNSFGRAAESAALLDNHPQERKRARERGQSPAPVPRSHRICRNNPESLMIGGEQQLAGGHGGPDDDKDDQKAQDRLATDRIPIEGEEGAEAAEDEGCNRAESKGETRSDDAQTILDGLHREPVEAAANPPRHLPEQPFGAETKRPENGEVEESLGLGREASRRDLIPVPEDAEVEENLAPPGVRVDRGDAGGGSLELVGQIRDGAGERNDLLVDRAGTGIYVVLERIVGLLRRRSSGLCHALLFQPLLGEQRQQLVGLWRQRPVSRSPVPGSLPQPAPQSRRTWAPPRASLRRGRSPRLAARPRDSPDRVSPFGSPCSRRSHGPPVNLTR